MNEKIKVETVSFSELKKVSEKFIVPSLQRPYVWEAKKHVKKFLDDIFENEKNYFIGSIVFVNSEDGTAGREEIIDGQQRITTIFLVLIALKKFIVKGKYEKKLEDISREISNFLSYIDTFDKREIPRLKFYDKTTDEYFNKILNKHTEEPLTESQNKIFNNLEYINDEFKECLNNDTDIRSFFERIKTLQIIGIRCLDNSIAYELFESINATGLSLANVDLVKNFIFKKFKNDKKKLKMIERRWNELEIIFSDDRNLFKTFLRHQWISGGEYVSHSALYGNVDKKYKANLLKLEEYVINLENDSKVYFAIRNSKIDLLDKYNSAIRNDKKIIRDVLEFLAFLSVDQVYAPTLYFFKNKDIKDFKKFLIRLTAFQFLYKYIPGSPSSAEKIFADMCNNKKNSNVNNLFGKLENLVVNQKGVFKEKFIEKAKYREGKSGDIQFVLERYVLSKEGPDSFKEPTIEHIISRSKEKIDKIGNLTIFGKVVNSELPEDFKKKVPFYKKSKYTEHKEIIKKYDFEKDYKEHIDRRGEDVAEEVYGIFINMLETGKYK